MDILFLTATGSGGSWLIDFFRQIQTLEAILLVLGLLLLVAEMFMPGFGIAGGTGIVLIAIGIILTARTPLEAFIMFLVLVLLVTGVILLLLRSAKKGQIARKLILHQSATKEKGFVAAKDHSQLVGQTGVSVTPLRPAGIGLFGESRLDVVTEGGFVDKGVPIQIIQVHGNRIVVIPTEALQKQ